MGEKKFSDPKLSQNVPHEIWWTEKGQSRVFWALESAQWVPRSREDPEKSREGPENATKTRLWTQKWNSPKMFPMEFGE